MQRIGTEWKTDWPKLGPSILIATALVVAIRTAKSATKSTGDPRLADVDSELDKEIGFAVRVTTRVMTELIRRHQTLFPGSYQPIYDGIHEEDTLK